MKIEIKENIGKPAHDIESLFEKSIKDGKLEAYVVEVDKRVTLRNNKRERITKTRKGATLTPTKKVEAYTPLQPLFIKDKSSGVMYDLQLGENQTGTYQWCILKRLINFNLKKAEKNRDHTSWGEQIEYGIDIPSDNIDGRLVMEYNNGYDKKEGTLTIEGKSDNLFSALYRFIKEE